MRDSQIALNSFGEAFQEAKVSKETIETYARRIRDVIRVLIDGRGRYPNMDLDGMNATSLLHASHEAARRILKVANLVEVMKPHKLQIISSTIMLDISYFLEIAKNRGKTIKLLEKLEATSKLIARNVEKHGGSLDARILDEGIYHS